jgi:hypothetical protein
VIRASLALVHDIEAWDVAPELGEISDLTLLERVAVERRDIDGNVLNVLLAPRRGYENHIDNGRILRRDR